MQDGAVKSQEAIPEHFRVVVSLVVDDVAAGSDHLMPGKVIACPFGVTPKTFHAAENGMACPNQAETPATAARGNTKACADLINTCGDADDANRAGFPHGEES